jgi:acetolactate synthase-1/2/3 large subunit
MNGASIIAQALKNVGIDRVYLFPGGTIAPLLDELTKIGIDYICTINEQGAGYAAIGAAKITGKPQVVMVTSGPGATNLVTPVADAYYDSVPIIAITGQVGTKDINYAKKIRQTGFQETDSTGIFTPVTKNSKILTKDVNLYDEIMESIAICTGGRPGPVHIDLPMDVQRDDIPGQSVNKEKWSTVGKSDGENPVLVIMILKMSDNKFFVQKSPLYLWEMESFCLKLAVNLTSFSV